jgi:ATP-dependent RNA helicase RhlE
LLEIPEKVVVVPTEFDEKQEYLREIDRQRKLDDPTFKGAFHKKKNIYSSKRIFEDKFQRTKERQKKGTGRSSRS